MFLLVAGLLLTPTVFPMAQDGPPPAVVVTAPVRTGPVQEEITLVGTVRPIVDSLFAAEIAGRVISRLVDRAATVKKGQVLFQLDSARFDRQLEAAEGEMIEVRARLSVARQQEARARDLHDSGVLADRFLDDAIGDRQALDGRLVQVEARVASIKDDIARTSIKAPFSGVVTELHTEVGEWIRLGDAVLRLANFDTIEIYLDVPERYYPHLAAGDLAPARLDALPGVELEGQVFAVVPQAGSAARTFPVIVRAANPGRQAAAGMLARVRLVLSSSDDVLQVPKDAIVRQMGGEAVFLLDGDAVRVVTVRSGRASGAHVEVAGDLAPGDLVVVRGNERLQPGQKVVATAAQTARAGSR